jgi:putative flippase GtrA
VASQNGVIARVAARVGGEQLLGQLGRYGIVVVSGYVLAIAFYAGEIALDIAPYLALGIAFVLNGLYNFALIRLWAFPPSGRGLRRDLARFSVVAAVSFVVNYASFAVLYSAIGLSAVGSQRLAILIAAPVTFFANRLWAFRVHRARGEPGGGVQPAGALAPTSARNDS